MPVRFTLPVLRSVKTWHGPPPMIHGMEPAPTPRAASGLQFVGVRVALTTRATPVPERATGEPATMALAVMDSDPTYDCAAVGVNATMIVQVPPAAKLVPQLPPDREKPAGKAPTVMPVRGPIPVLCSVRVRVGLGVVPTTTLPKANGPPVTLATAGPPAPWNSTAPTSNRFCTAGSGLGLPKKSVLGVTAKVEELVGT